MSGLSSLTQSLNIVSAFVQMVAGWGGGVVRCNSSKKGKSVPGKYYVMCSEEYFSQS